MFDFIFSVFAGFVKEYRFRRFLRKNVVMHLSSGAIVSPKALVRYADLAEKQARIRQIYGIASCGGSCSVEFENGKAVVYPLVSQAKK